MNSQGSSGRDVVPPDIEIARNTDRRAIEDVGADLGLEPSDVERRGDEVAKVTWPAIQRALERPADGSLVLVTAMTPTRRGAGKTVTTTDRKSVV